MATDLGELIYTLTLNSEGFAAGVGAASTEMDGMAGAADTTAVSVDTAAASADTAGGAFDFLKGSIASTLLPLAAAFGLYEGGSEIIKGVIEATNTHASTENLLEQQLKNTNDAIGLNVKQLNDMADAQSKGTVVSADADLAAEQQFLTNDKINKQILPQAVSLTNDLATAMAKGVPTTQQVTQASNLLGKALENPTAGVNSLTRAHITLSATQIAAVKQMAATGNITGADSLLMKDLAGKVGGDATSATKTFTGSLAELNNKLEPLKVTVGTDIEKAITWLGQAVAYLLPILESWADYVGKLLTPLLNTLWSVIQNDLIPIINKNKQLFQDIGIAILLFVVAPIALAIAAFAAIVAITIAVISVLTWLYNTVNDVINWFLKMNGEVFNAVLSMENSVINSIVAIINWFTSLGNKITSTVSNFGNLLVNAGKDLINGLVKGVQDGAQDVFNAVSNIGTQAVSKLKGVLKIFSPSQVFADIGQNVSLGLAQGISQGADTAVQATSQLGSAVINAGAVVPSSISNSSSSSTIGNNYNFSAGSIVLSTADAVDEFFSIGNRNTQLELLGGSPLPGTTSN